MNDDKISKLPKWVQAHINNLQRQRDEAVSQLDQFQQDQTGPFKYWTFSSHTSPPKHVERRFDSNSMEVEHVGVIVKIHLREDCIELQWNSIKRMMGDVIFQPISFQTARLKLPESS